MRSVSFGRWTVNSDAESTKIAYAVIAIGAPESATTIPAKTFVGDIASGQDAAVQVSQNVWQPSLEPVSDTFTLGFTAKVAMVPKSFQGLQLVQLEFTTQLAWVLETTEPN